MGGPARPIITSVGAALAPVTGGASVLGANYLNRKPPSPPKIPKLPDEETPLEGETPSQAAARRRKMLLAASNLMGRDSTVSTSPLGLTEPASTTPRRLLGF